MILPAIPKRPDINRTFDLSIDDRRRDHRGMRFTQLRCPIRPGEPCTLCQVSVTGPQDCGLVYLVMGDEELRAGVRAQSRVDANRLRVDRAAVLSEMAQLDG